MGLRGALALFTLGLIVAGCEDPQIIHHPNLLQYEDLDYSPPSPLKYRDTLENGIPVYLVEDKRLPVIDVSAIIKTGFMYNPDSLVGLSSLTARLMRTGGTKSLSADEVDKRIELLAAGLSSGASISSASASLNILKKHWSEGLKIFSEMMMHPRFEQEKLDLEKKKAYEQIEHRWDAPSSVLAHGFNRIIHTGWERGKISTKESIKRISRQDIIGFHRKHYVPQNVYFSVSGDFKKEEMLETLDGLFGKWHPREMSPSAHPEWRLAVPSGKLFFVEKESNQAIIRMAHKCIQRPHRDYYALSVLNYILGGAGFNSRLLTKVRSDEGLAYSVRSGVEPNYFFPGLFTISLQTKSKSAAYAMRLCLDEFRRACTTYVSDAELDAAKRSLILSFPILFKTSKGIAEIFAISEFWGRNPNHFDVYCAKINALTKEKLLSAAQKHLHPDSLVFVVVGKQEECEKGDGEHPAKLSDFGEVVKVDVEDLKKETFVLP